MTDVSDALRAEAAAPSTTMERLAELAQLHPELRSLILANPSCYPGLRDWIAQVSPELFAAPSAQPATPVAQGAVPPRRSRALLFGGIAAGLVVLLVAGGIVAYSAFFSKLGGAASPDAAVHKLIDGVSTLDAVSLYGSISPAEIASFSEAIDTMKNVKPTAGGAEQLDYATLLNRLKDASTVDLTNLEFTVDEFEPGIAKVTLASGDLRVDGDSAEIADIFASFERASIVANQDALGYSDSDVDDAVNGYRDSFTTSIGDALPYSLDASEIQDSLGFPLSLISVKEGGSWYVSPLLSYGEFLLDSANVNGDYARGSLVAAADAGRFDSPEAATEGLLDATSSFASSGNIDDLAVALPLAERRFVSLYLAPFTDASFAGQSQFDLSWDNLTLDTTTSGSTARMQLNSLSLALGVGGQSSGSPALSADITGVCATWNAGYSTGEGCLDDVPTLNELGIADARVIAVREDGGWYVSPLQTAGYLAAVMASRYSDLASSGNLDKLG